LGSFIPSPISSYSPEADSAGGFTLPTEYSPLDWKAELLVSPHNADNEMDVNRLRSSHPTHESAFVIRDDRLLGE
uniref:Glyco_transf_41 domain-containing protein n=1 Tax=Echinostoma caproni TaxID=27848 RepID=A0A183BCY1_9TREM